MFLRIYGGGARGAYEKQIGFGLDLLFWFELVWSGSLLSRPDGIGSPTILEMECSLGRILLPMNHIQVPVYILYMRMGEDMMLM